MAGQDQNVRSRDRDGDRGEFPRYGSKTMAYACMASHGGSALRGLRRNIGPSVSSARGTALNLERVWSKIREVVYLRITGSYTQFLQSSWQHHRYSSFLRVSCLIFVGHTLLSRFLIYPRTTSNSRASEQQKASNTPLLLL